MRYTWFAALLLVAGCTARSPEAAHDEQVRLRRSLEKHHGRYVASIETENRLVTETLAWLNGNAISASRAQAVAEARRLTDRWSRVYFVPRYMHEELRFDKYSSAQVRAVQRQMLDRLKRHYFQLHDYQRYAQNAAESEMHHTPPGRLPRELEEFRSGLESREPSVDEIRPLIEFLKK